MAEIDQYLKDRGICNQIEKIGSTYEDLNVDEDDTIQLEMVAIQTVIGSDVAVEKINDKGDYACLRFLNSQNSSPTFDQVLKDIFGSLIGTRYLDKQMTADLFKRELQNCIAESEEMNGKVRLILNGPVLRMEVYPESWMLSWGSCLYTLDIVPAYKIDEELYELRPIRGYEVPDDKITWHRSFALQEKQMLCDGSKMVLRVLKVLRKRLPDFGNFTSYQLKTVVLHEIDATKDWKEIMFWKRLVDVLARLDKHLEVRNLPHFFLPQINLLSNMDTDVMNDLRDRIQGIPTEESELRRFLLPR